MATAFSTKIEVPSDQVLDATLDRALDFLEGVTKSPALARVLKQYGYTDRDQELGWKLYYRVRWFRDEQLALHNNGAAAIAEIGQQIGAIFRRSHAALGHLHPEQDGFVFLDLEPTNDVSSVGALEMFLDRLDILESSEERKKTRKSDRAALTTLAARGIDKEMRNHLRKRVKLAKAIADLPEADPMTTAKLDQHEKDRLALRAWYSDWAETARTLLKDRKALIRVGLARRAKRKAEKGPETGPGAGTGAGGDVTPLVPQAAVAVPAKPTLPQAA